MGAKRQKNRQLMLAFGAEAAGETCPTRDQGTEASVVGNERERLASRLVNAWQHAQPGRTAVCGLRTHGGVGGAGP